MWVINNLYTEKDNPNIPDNIVITRHYIDTLLVK